MFDWVDLEYLAKFVYEQAQLPNCPTPEAFLRCVIGRAYYAIFILLRNYLRDIENNPNITDDFVDIIRIHSLVQQELERSPKRVHWWAARLLKELRKMRNKADYQDYYGDLGKLSKDAKVALGYLRDIIVEFA